MGPEGCLEGRCYQQVWQLPGRPQSQQWPSTSHGGSFQSSFSFSMKRFRDTEHRVLITSVAQERGTTTPSLQTRARVQS